MSDCLDAKSDNQLKESVVTVCPNGSKTNPVKKFLSIFQTSKKFNNRNQGQKPTEQYNPPS